MMSPLPTRTMFATLLLMLALQFSHVSALAGFQLGLQTSKFQLRRTAVVRAQADEDEAMKKALKAMTGFANSYCKNTGTTYCEDPSIPSVVIKGLAEHKVALGAPLCPCRHYEDKAAEAKDGYWNCPCVPMRERHECHCMLFLTADNEFAGKSQSLSVEEVESHTDNMGSIM